MARRVLGGRRSMSSILARRCSVYSVRADCCAGVRGERESGCGEPEEGAARWTGEACEASRRVPIDMQALRLADKGADASSRLTRGRRSSRGGPEDLACEPRPRARSAASQPSSLLGRKRECCAHPCRDGRRGTARQAGRRVRRRATCGGRRGQQARTWLEQGEWGLTATTGHCQATKVGSAMQRLSQCEPRRAGLGG